MAGNIKALIVQAEGKDLGDILQIGRAEAMKIFKNPVDIKVLFHTVCPYGHILVVQNCDGSSAK
jgi:hypothetical protein